MSLVWCDPFNYRRPSRVARRGFWDPEEIFEPLIPRELSTLFHQGPNWLSEISSGDQVTFDKDKFNVNVDVQQFRPDEISVKATDGNTITIEGKHEERPDEHGYISRQFVRRYVVPKGHDVSKVETRLSSDGVLTITAPKVGDPKADTKEIPIVRTGQPSKPIENKTANKK